MKLGDATKSDDLDASFDRTVQYVWGVRYIDDILLHRDRDAADTDWLSAETYWHLTDAQFSMVSLTQSSQSFENKTRYDSYGVARSFRPGDLNADGQISLSYGPPPTYTPSGEYVDVLTGTHGDLSDGSGTDYQIDRDINMDGKYDSSDDASTLNTHFGKPVLTAGQLSDETVDSRVGYAGYIFDPELGYYSVRHRSYDPGVGRWLQRDPAEYIDGSNTLEYVAGRPVIYMDPMGLAIHVRRPTSGSRGMKSIEEDLDTLCPGTRVDASGKIELPPKPEGEADCPNPCKSDPPGCKKLRQLQDSDNNYLIDPSSPGLYQPFRNRRYIRYLHDQRNRPAGSRSRDWSGGGLFPSRNVAPWEVLWHEITHAHRHESGDRDQNFDSSLEEFMTIEEMDKMREWLNKCNIGSPHRGTPPRDPYGHGHSSPSSGMGRPYRELPDSDTYPVSPRPY